MLEPDDPHTEPDISVVMITYNHADYVEQAVRSILEQVHARTWELVIADDCSTDGTLRVIERIRDGDDRIKLLPTDTNLGAQRNFRRVLEAATGRYVAVLEGDDYWVDPARLATQYELLERRPEVSAVGGLTAVVRGTEPTNDIFQPRLLQCDDLTMSEVGAQVFPHLSSLMFRRTAFPTTPAWFDRLHQADWPMCMLLAQNGPLAMVHHVVSAHRYHDTSTFNPLPRLQQKALTVHAVLVLRRTGEMELGGIEREIEREIDRQLDEILWAMRRTRRLRRIIDAARTIVSADPRRVARWAVRRPFRRRIRS